MSMPLACVFFDVFSSLGLLDGRSRLRLHANTVALLADLRALDLRLGVISNLPPTHTRAELLAMLADAEILEFFDHDLIISSRSVDARFASMHLRAAAAGGVALQDCMFVGDRLGEVVVR